MTRILLRGGNIHAVHTPDAPLATAVCVEDGVIVWVGGDEASVHYADGADRVLDLQGRLVTPAFVDAHAHLAQTGFAMAGVDFSGVTSLGQALDVIASAASASSTGVVVGFGWDDTLWPEQRPFTREEVDRATGGRSAYLGRVDEHSAVLSSAFLDACPDVVHSEGYDASGLVTRDAHHVAREGLFGMQPAAARETAIHRALDDAARHGVAMVHELGAPHISPPEDFAVIDALTAREVLPEVVGYWGELGAVDRAVSLGCVGAAGDLCMDGSVGSRTSALHASYTDDPTTGHLYLDADQVAGHVVECTQKGVQAGFHVIGDRAVAEVVAGFQAATAEIGAPAVVAGRHRLEHVEMAAPEEMAVLGSLGVTASMQPMFDGYWGGPDSLYAQRLGTRRASTMNAFASMERAGVALAFGSDSPVTPFDPWAGVRAAAWHRTEGERIPVQTAFDAHTRGGWLAARRDEGGMIVAGAPASIAVWDVPGDLVALIPDTPAAAWSTEPLAGRPLLPDLHPDTVLPTCVLTLVAGRVAYELEGVWT